MKNVFVQRIYTAVLLFIFIFHPLACRATIFFEDDFEAELNSSPNPVWSWRSPYAPDNIYGMMYGPGDIYERASEIKHSGNYSLRLDMSGRNGVCNTCGSYATLDQKSGYLNVDYFVSADGSNLANTCHQPDANRPVYNRSDYWSRWIPESVQNQDTVNDRLNFSSFISSMGGRGENDIDAGDDLICYRKCGEDGNAGSDINRRSDCDSAINYLQGITADNHPLGSSIFRRIYFYISEDGMFPEWGLKLGYYHATGNQSSWTTVIGGDFISDRNGNIHIDGSIGWTESSNPKITRGEWWYLEEQFKRENSDSANDGEYRMWYAKAGTDPGNPKIEKIGLDLHQISTDGTGMSIIGNWQHWNDSTAKVYIDEIVIANERIGLDESQSDPTPPGSPANLTVR